MPNYTRVLQLTGSELQNLNQQYYWERAAFDAAVDSTLAAVDAWAGKVSGSFTTKFSLPISGSNVSQVVTNAIAGGYLGSAYAKENRVIKEVVAWAATSGSGGVSRIDVQIQQGAVEPANFSSIFSNNAFKPAVSASLGNFGRAKSATFVSGSNMVWAKGTILKVVADTAAGDATAPNGQFGLTVEICWVPSASYGV